MAANLTCGTGNPSPGLNCFLECAKQTDLGDDFSQLQLSESIGDRVGDFWGLLLSTPDLTTGNRGHDANLIAIFQHRGLVFEKTHVLPVDTNQDRPS